MKEKNVAGAARSHMVLSPASFTHDYQQKLDMLALTKDVKKDPTFDLDNSFLVGQYDNIQLIIKQTDETGAGSLGKKKQLVQVRTARMMMQVQNSTWAKLQRDYKHKPGVMARKYPLADVPADCIKISTIPVPDNTDNHSDKSYLDLEYLFNMKFAVELVLKKNDAWKHEPRGNCRVTEIERLKESEKFRKECSTQHGGCGFLNFNSFGWCRACAGLVGKNCLLWMPSETIF